MEIPVQIFILGFDFAKFFLKFFVLFLQIITVWLHSVKINLQILRIHVRILVPASDSQQLSVCFDMWFLLRFIIIDPRFSHILLIREKLHQIIDFILQLFPLYLRLLRQTVLLYLQLIAFLMFLGQSALDLFKSGRLLLVLVNVIIELGLEDIKVFAFGVVTLFLLLPFTIGNIQLLW